MENFTVWNCDTESFIFLLNLTFQRLNIQCDLMVKKVVYNLRFLIKALKAYPQLITALNNSIFVYFT